MLTQKLIYDRTLQDVAQAIASQDNTEFNKGAYNYTDLNRIEEYLKYFQDLFNTNLGTNIQLELNLDYNNYSSMTGNYEDYSNITYQEILCKGAFKQTDIPYLETINVIRKNIDILRNVYKDLLNNLATIQYKYTLDYKQANLYEEILYNLHKYYELFINNKQYCGLTIVGQSLLLPQ